ncbi:MAG: hypothetical protein PWP24_1283 [Clostridiales bacterium]|nr:hypothetical protein [Clostridiales bacterium]
MVIENQLMFQMFRTMKLIMMSAYLAIQHNCFEGTPCYSV